MGVIWMIDKIKLIDGTEMTMEECYIRTLRELQENKELAEEYITEFRKRQNEPMREDIFDSWEPEPDIQYPIINTAEPLSTEEIAKLNEIEFEVF